MWVVLRYRVQADGSCPPAPLWPRRAPPPAVTAVPCYALQAAHSRHHTTVGHGPIPTGCLARASCRQNSSARPPPGPNPLATRLQLAAGQLPFALLPRVRSPLRIKRLGSLISRALQRLQAGTARCQRRASPCQCGGAPGGCRTGVSRVEGGWDRWRQCMDGATVHNCSRCGPERGAQAATPAVRQGPPSHPPMPSSPLVRHMRCFHLSAEANPAPPTGL